MVVETTREQIVLNQIIGQKKETRAVETDIIVNDVKPDVLNIISTSGVICIYKKEIMDGKIRIDGGINTYIIYLADDEHGSVRSLNSCLNFTQIIDIENCKEGMFSEENIIIKNFETKIINGRKINVTANLEIGIKVYLNENVEIVTGVSNLENMQILNNNQMVTSLIGFGTNKVYAKDTVSIDVADDIAEIMKISFKISEEETKISYNKVLSKANAEIEMMYLTEDNRINTVIAKLPVMGVIDMLNVNDNCICKTKNILKNLVIKPNNTDEHSIYIEAEVEISCATYESREINIIEDLYSLTDETEASKKQINIMTRKHKMKDVCKFKENIRIPDLAGTIYNISVKPTINRCEAMNNRILYEGEVSLEILFEQNNGMNSRTIQLPFNFETSSEGVNNDSILETSITVGESDAIIKDGNVEVVIMLDFNIDIESNTRLDLIQEIKTEENRDCNMYSMVIYFVKPGDTLWKIAKMFKSSVAEIAQINEIEDVNRISVGQQLYIPRCARNRIIA